MQQDFLFMVSWRGFRWPPLPGSPPYSCAWLSHFPPNSLAVIAANERAAILAWTVTGGNVPRWDTCHLLCASAWQWRPAKASDWQPHSAVKHHFTYSDIQPMDKYVHTRVSGRREYVYIYIFFLLLLIEPIKVLDYHNWAQACKKIPTIVFIFDI